MKKLKYLMIAAIAVFGVAVSSCDNDDDDKGGVAARPEISDFGGERLVSAGDVHFSYNSDGTLRQVEEYGDKIIFDYSKGTLTFSDGEVTQVCRFTTNDKGYITSIILSFVEDEGDSKYQLEGSYQFQYDAYDHLTAASYNSVSTDLASKEQYEENASWKLTWNAGLLSKVEEKGSSVQDDYSNTYNLVNTFSYDNAPDNLFLQYSNSVVESINLDSDVELPMFVGVLGKGPTKYPTAIVEVFNSEDSDSGPSTETENFTYKYTLNAKGLVEREAETYYGEPYIVDYTYSSDSKAKSPCVDSRSAVVKKHRTGNRHHMGLFGRRK